MQRRTQKLQSARDATTFLKTKTQKEDPYHFTHELARFMKDLHTTASGAAKKSTPSIVSITTPAPASTNAGRVMPWIWCCSLCVAMVDGIDFL